MSGGAWKVAYADFVTAMMALFMVLWIISQDKEIVEITALYFKNPIGDTHDRKSSLVSVNKEDQGQKREEKEEENKATSVVDLAFLNKLAAEFYRLLDVKQEDDEAPVDIKLTNDGLRITIFNRSKQPLFVGQSAIFTEWGKYVIQNLAWVMDRYPLKIRIDAFTAAGSKALSDEYGPWELTSDQANSARRLLEHFAVDVNKVAQVSGFGDTKPLPNISPNSESNQRLELSLAVK